MRYRIQNNAPLSTAEQNKTASLTAGSSPRELTDIEIASVVGGNSAVPLVPEAGMYNVRGGLGGGGGGCEGVPVWVH